jgi:hypothetical protein
LSGNKEYIGVSFCPLIREICKGNVCTMWSDEKCLIVNYLNENFLTEEDLDYEPIAAESSETEIPNWVVISSPEDIVSEYMRYLESEFPDSEPYGIWDLFRKNMGCYHTFNMTHDMELKLEKARLLADEQLRKRREEKIQERREKEFYNVDSWVDQFFDYLKSKNNNKVRLSDVNSFVNSKNLDILGETRREIYDRSKVKEEELYRLKVERERNELPSLIDQCFDWAINRGLSRLTKSDIKSFLFEFNYNITSDIENQLYALANTKMKSKR